MHKVIFTEKKKSTKIRLQHRGRGLPPPPYFFPTKIMSRYISIVTMDYADKSDVEVFTVKLTLVMNQRETASLSRIHIEIAQISETI